MMNDSYHIYFKGEILFKNLSKDEFEFVWEKTLGKILNPDASNKIGEDFEQISASIV